MRKTSVPSQQSNQRERPARTVPSSIATRPRAFQRASLTRQYRRKKRAANAASGSTRLLSCAVDLDGKKSHAYVPPKMVMDKVTGVILAAGRGRRMGRLGTASPKACLPICNRPLLHSHLSLLRSLDVRSVVIVVGLHAEKVVACAKSSVSRGMDVRFVHQPEPLGIAEALARTRNHVSENLVVILGDTYLVPGDPGQALHRLVTGTSSRPAAILSIREEPSLSLIRNECTVRYDSFGRLMEIREKPDQPFNHLKPCGLYFFTHVIFDAIDCTSASVLRGEIELTDAIQSLVAGGHEVSRANAIRWDININSPDDLLRANLNDLARRQTNHVVHPSAQIHPRASLRQVVVGAGARITVPAILDRVVMLPGSRVEAAGEYRSLIVARESWTVASLGDQSQFAWRAEHGGELP
jgi:glucose-1-phosphate thymidylyltransferase